MSEARQPRFQFGDLVLAPRRVWGKTGWERGVLNKAYITEWSSSQPQLMNYSIHWVEGKYQGFEAWFDEEELQLVEQASPRSVCWLARTIYKRGSDN